MQTLVGRAARGVAGAGVRESGDDLEMRAAQARVRRARRRGRFVPCHDRRLHPTPGLLPSSAARPSSRRASISRDRLPTCDPGRSRSSPGLAPCPGPQVREVARLEARERQEIAPGGRGDPCGGYPTFRNRPGRALEGCTRCPSGTVNPDRPGGARREPGRVGRGGSRSGPGTARRVPGCGIPPRGQEAVGTLFRGGSRGMARWAARLVATWSARWSAR